MEQEDVEKHLLYRMISLQAHWRNSGRKYLLWTDFESRRQKLEDENKRWRFVAKLENGKGSVSFRK